MRKYDPVYCYSWINRKTKQKDHEWLTLTEEEQAVVKETVCEFLKPIKSINKNHSSYGLKHMIEDKVGFYVSNSDCKKALTECGFRHMPCDGFEPINWFFNISEKSIKDLTFVINKGESV